MYDDSSVTWVQTIFPSTLDIVTVRSIVPRHRLPFLRLKTLGNPRNDDDIQSLEKPHQHFNLISNSEPKTELSPLPATEKNPSEAHLVGTSLVSKSAKHLSCQPSIDHWS